ncbi:FGGY-family carbohydrate kinase [uncultured Roseobacter sp.]|uniref:FGGY-family carbohydrate kinase n=1 Tax=uncultured Roseobacter sp. TaxID=114847 RepID=UPI002636436E|nr:FGGY-family carbohydrate kinase [uncultured Roseobacter sp.]
MTAFVGVDVGTGSARAGVFDASGALLASHAQDIRMWRDGEIAEQSSDDIWSAVCACVKEAVAQAGLAPEEIKGLGFDAACSMVVVDRDMRPLSISDTGAAERNVIVWMDHRAKGQAERINATGHPVLDYVGGRISPEMQTPKLLWIKDNLPASFDAAGQFFDLPDFLTWAATGSLTRSACTVTCKWTYLAHEDRWDESYFNRIGLGDIAAEGFARIGQHIVPPGTALDNGLTARAATEMGLIPRTPVAAALIDAHAGGIGTVGADPEAGPEATMAYVFGTSACTMASSKEPHKVPGVWGPYYSAMVPGLWLSEGGQSAAGEAIAHLISTHPAKGVAQAQASKAGLSLQDYLLEEVTRRSLRMSDAVKLAGRKLIVPDFLGNRAPFANPEATAVIAGLTLRTDVDDLIATYVAGVTGIGYGLRQIMQAQAGQGVRPQAIVISGGAGRSAAIKQMLADASGVPILSTTSAEPVLLGAAILGAVASRQFATLTEAMGQMSSIEARFTPTGGRTAKMHQTRFDAFELLQAADHHLQRELLRE